MVPVTGLGRFEQAVLIALVGLVESKGAVPMTRIPVIHLFNDVAAGKGGLGGGFRGLALGNHGEQCSDEEYSTHFG